MSNNYQDKEFKDIYGEIIDKVKNLTTKWDPSISDESDPGVVILKAFSLFIDKLNYKINYRNAQNSVENVTDPVEAKRLFSELGYRVKRKKSATGEIQIRYIGDQSIPFILPLFTQFSNQSGSQNYTAIRTSTTLERNVARLIKVQEGIPLRYSYEGKTSFSTDDISTNLRLSLMGLEEVSENGVVIISENFIEDGAPLASDWLNVEDNVFTSVETDNIFSIGYDREGKPYIQFYEKSLASLKKGIGIWIISSSGSAGNVPQNTINQIVSTLEGIEKKDFVISHSDFINGQDEESIESSRVNYYDSFGVNNTLIGERDYEVALLNVLRPDLTKLASKVLVTGVDGYHNLIEVISLVNDEKDRVILTQFLEETLLSHIYINALKSTNNYYDSFTQLSDSETENLMRKSIYKNNVVSNNLVLLSNPDGVTGYDRFLYNRYLYDIVSPEGTIIIDSSEDKETLANKIVLAISKAFNSVNLVEGELIPETRLSEIVENELEGVISASFYYKDHNVVKGLVHGSPTEEDILSITNSSDAEEKLKIEGIPFRDKDRVDILARSILKGDLSLFKNSEIQVPPGAVFPKETDNNYIDNSKEISSIKGEYSIQSGGRFLNSNELIQFYRVALNEAQHYGLGINFALFAEFYTSEEDIELREDKTSILKAGSKLAEGSILENLTSEGLSKIEGENYSKETVTEEKEGITYSYTTIVVNNGGCTLIGDLTLQNKPHRLSRGSRIADGSTIFENGSTIPDKHRSGDKVYGLVLKNDIEYNLLQEGTNISLCLQTGEGVNSIVEIPNETSGLVKISGFDKGLISSGPRPDSIQNNIDKLSTYLTSGQNIIQYGEQKIEARGINYGLISTSKIVLDQTNNYTYILAEGEHLIYSDDLLVDFVDFGSGTLLKSSEKIELTNIITYENLATSLKKLDKSLEIYNTEIFNFRGENIRLTFSTGLPKLNSTWAKIGDSDHPDWIKIEEFDGNRDNLISTYEFNYNYSYRGSLILSTGNKNTFTTKEGQKLTITYSDGSESEVGGNYILSTSAPIFINTSDSLNIGKLKMRGYTIAISTSSTGNPGGYVVKPGTSPEYSNGRFIIDLPLEGNNGKIVFGLNKKKYVLKMGFKFAGRSSIAKFSMGTSQNSINDPGSNYFNFLNSSKGYSESFSATIPGNEEEVPLLYIDGEKGDLVIELLNVSEDDVISIIDFTEISGYSEYLEGIGEEVYKRLEGDSNSLLNGDIIFDYDYRPESPLNPLENRSFYDSNHIMNRNILTVMDLKYLRENLRIVRRNR